MARKNVLHLCVAGAYHVAGAIIAARQAALSAAVEADIGQRKDVWVVALVQIKLLLSGFPKLALQLADGLFEGTERIPRTGSPAVAGQVNSGWFIRSARLLHFLVTFRFHSLQFLQQNTVCELIHVCSAQRETWVGASINRVTYLALRSSRSKCRKRSLPLAEQ